MQADELELSRTQLRELDRLAIEEYGIAGLVLMENAGLHAAQHVSALLRERASSARRVAVFCGAGNNGADGCVVTRQLAVAGVEVDVYVTEAVDALRGDALIQRRIIERMSVRVHDVSSAAGLERARAQLASSDVLVDALLGTGFHGAVRERSARVIGAINAERNTARRPAVVALDLPSGLDCDSGEPSNATIVADLTVSFAARKLGFRNPRAHPFLGVVVVASIGVPSELLARVRGLASERQRE